MLRTAGRLSNYSLWLLQWLSFVEIEVAPLTPPPLDLESVDL